MKKNEAQESPSNSLSQARAKAAKTRALRLSAEQRSAIAKQGASARWDTSIAQVIHGSVDNPLRLGSIEMDCYILAGGNRVFSERGMFAGLGITSRGGEIKRLIQQCRLQSFLSDEALGQLNTPLKFRATGGGGPINGYPVTLLIDLCNALLDASQEADFPRSYETAKTRAGLIIRAVAKVGIIALVDEVTGFDEHRQEKLQAILDRYLRTELAAWAKRFPDEFYFQIFRLRGWAWKGRKVNPPGVVARYTKDIVYSRLAPGLLAELEQRNPKIGNSRKGKHHQLLTNDVGHPELQRHLYMVIGIMKAETSWDTMMEKLDHALPRYNGNLRLPLSE